MCSCSSLEGVDINELLFNISAHRSTADLIKDAIGQIKYEVIKLVNDKQFPSTLPATANGHTYRTYPDIRTSGACSE